MLESSSETHIENNEGKSQESLIQEASTQPFIIDDVVDTSSANDFEVKNHNDLNENEAKFNISEEENYLQNKSKQVVEHHLEQKQSEKGDISEDKGDTLGESDEMNKNEVIDKVSNIAHMNDP
jgi:hypothetical protein